jgi:MFS transporter, DHA1 family, multidrug resistance protein
MYDIMQSQEKIFKKIAILITVIFMEVLSGMELDLFTPSFPELAQIFHLSPAWLESLLSVNFISYCLSTFYVGVLSDRYGRRPVIICGIIIFLLGSFLCIFAKSYSFLLFGRVLQGIGAAAPATLSFLIVADIWSLKKQQYFMAMLNSIINISFALAPILGSYISLYYHWQGNFVFLIIASLFVLILVQLFIPKSTKAEIPESLSLRGFLPILQSKPLMLMVTHNIAILAPYWIFIGISPLLYIRDLHISLAHFGFYQGSATLLFALGSLFYGLIMHKFAKLKTLYFANFLFILSAISLSIVALYYAKNPLIITLSFVIFALSEVIPVTIIYPACLNFIPKLKGRISGFMIGSRLIFSACGVQLAGYCYNGTVTSVNIIIIAFIILSIITLHLITQDPKIMEKL